MDTGELLRIFSFHTTTLFTSPAQTAVALAGTVTVTSGSLNSHECPGRAGYLSGGMEISGVQRWQGTSGALCAFPHMR